MSASQQRNKPTEALNSDFFAGETTPDLLARPCPHCHSEAVIVTQEYKTKHNGSRSLYTCEDCGACFSQTYGSPIAGLTKPLSEIIKVLKALTDGQGLNSTARTFGVSKNTILN